MGFLTPELSRRMDDKMASKRAEAAGISTPPLSKYWIGRTARQGLMLGYAAMPDAAIDPAMERLAEALARREPPQPERTPRLSSAS